MGVFRIRKQNTLLSCLLFILHLLFGFQGRMNDEEEFVEEEIWNVMMEGKQSRSTTTATATIMAKKGKDLFSASISSSSSSSSTPPRKQHTATASRVTIPKFNGCFKKSAPVEISHSSPSCNNGGVIGGADHHEEDDDDKMIPPHEWIAKKLASTQVSSYSMLEGRGRTLKGRDLRKVRNAILTRTGFLE